MDEMSLWAFLAAARCLTPIIKPLVKAWERRLAPPPSRPKPKRGKAPRSTNSSR